MTPIILKLSAFNKSIFWHGGENYIVLGVVGVFLGLLVGWLVWYQCRRQAIAIRKSNDELREMYDALQNQQSQIESVIDKV